MIGRSNRAFAACRFASRRFAARTLAMTALLCLAPGCDNAGMIADYEKRIIELEERVRDCETRRLSDRERASQYIRRFQSGGTAAGAAPSGSLAGAAGREAPIEAAMLYAPTELVFDPLTGGSNFDESPGDDGVTVYIKPLDRFGDPVKTPATVKIELIDLAGPRVIGRYQIGPEKLGEMWISALMTDHFAIKCPWQNGPPTNNELTVRVAFEDYMSGRTLTAQGNCTVKVRNF